MVRDEGIQATFGDEPPHSPAIRMALPAMAEAAHLTTGRLERNYFGISQRNIIR
jgi:hypothetical protein